MIDITDKPETLRQADAEGSILLERETIERIEKMDLPKGNLFDTARAAALLASKKTSELIPHCHPVVIDGMDILFELNKKENLVKVLARGKSISRTGIEMEVLTAVSVALLTIYDLLKPVDKNMSIGNIKLLHKSGGRTQYRSEIKKEYHAAILVCSDSTSKGTRTDKSGKIIEQLLHKYNVRSADYQIVPDDIQLILEQLNKWINEDIPFIFTTGGTGLGPRDNTIDAIKLLNGKYVEGIGEAMRSYGQKRTLKAMLSRSAAVVKNKTLIIALPGSSNGARESLEAILPAVFHARRMIEGDSH